MMNTIKLNINPLLPMQSIEINHDPLWKPVYLKNRYYREITSINRTFRQIVDIMFDNLVNHFKYQYIDVKVQDLEVGKNTANGLWHLDSSLNPDAHYENQIYVSGINRTEFVTNEISIPPYSTPFEFNKLVEAEDLVIEKIPNQTIIKFDGRNVHRGVNVTVPEKRLLIRLINTDRELPHFI